MKQLEVLIMGQSYLLGCPEGGDDRLRDAVGKVDTAMCQIRDSGKVRARDRIAVLAAINLAFDLMDQGKADAKAAFEASSSGSADASGLPSARLEALIAQIDDVLAQDTQLL